MGPFVPVAGRAAVIPYHRVPVPNLEDGGFLCASARAAWEAARRSAHMKGKSRK